MMKSWIVPEEGNPGKFVIIRSNFRPRNALSIDAPKDLFDKPLNIREEEFTLTEERLIPDSEGRQPGEEDYIETVDIVPVVEEFLVPDPEGRQPEDPDYIKTVDTRPIVRTRLIPELDVAENTRREAERQARIDAENDARLAREAKINLARRASQARNLEELKQMVQALTDVLLGEEIDERGNSESRN